jgi:DDE superfamily endonuclease
MVIFKGKAIEKSLWKLPKGALYAVQDNLCMDQHFMLLRVQKILAPHIETTPSHVAPLLLLDSYHRHLMPSVVGAIEALGVEIAHIPGGCTGYCQPIDVGIGFPLKNHLKNQFKSWQFVHFCSHASENQPPPDPDLVAQWTILSLKNISSEIMKNAWLHRPFSYFDNEGGPRSLLSWISFALCK